MHVGKCHIMQPRHLVFILQTVTSLTMHLHIDDSIQDQTLIHFTCIQISNNDTRISSSSMLLFKFNFLYIQLLKRKYFVLNKSRKTVSIFVSPSKKIFLLDRLLMIINNTANQNCALFLKTNN